MPIRCSHNPTRKRVGVTKNDGTALQDAIQSVLKDRMSLTPGFMHRFSDSKAARNLTTNQPSDLLWLEPGLPAILIECKSTDTGEPLKDLLKTSTSKQQLGKARLWLRARGLSCYVWADLTMLEIKIYDGRSLVRGDMDPIATGMMPELSVLLPESFLLLR